MSETPTPPGTPSRKVPPNPDRPKLSPEMEEGLVPVNQRAAEAYDALEAVVTQELELSDSEVHLILPLPRRNG
jgi:hypothetical protein